MYVRPQDLARPLHLKASDHWAGGGMERGPDFVATRRHLARLRKNSQGKLARLLHRIVVGAMWPRYRRHLAGMQGHDGVCPRCGEGLEDE